MQSTFCFTFAPFTVAILGHSGKQYLLHILHILKFQKYLFSDLEFPKFFFLKLFALIWPLSAFMHVCAQAVWPSISCGPALFVLHVCA